MPNHKSTAKRMRQNPVRRARNQKYRTRLKHTVRKVRLALEEGDVAAAEAALPDAISELATVAGKGVIPQKRASRKISRLTKAVNRARAEAAES